jgi:hypothetical protein
MAEPRPLPLSDVFQFEWRFVCRRCGELLVSQGYTGRQRPKLGDQVSEQAAAASLVHTCRKEPHPHG